MARLIWVCLFAFIPLIAATGSAYSDAHRTDQSPADYLSRLPKGLKLREAVPTRYKVYCDYFNLDTLGNLNSKDRISGEYTRALPGGKARWDNVRIAHGKGFDDPFPEGVSQTYMDGFT